MDAYDEHLDLHMDTNLTTLPTPHPRRVASLASSPLVSSVDDMHSPQHHFEASQPRPCAGVLIHAPQEVPQLWPCAGVPITHHVNMATSTLSIVLAFSSTWGPKLWALPRKSNPYRPHHHRQQGGCALTGNKCTWRNYNQA